ncbi:hypothetical protein [Actinomyces marmotae]|uniref:hypothetical protein n=1 Tax=Actinomyces marmotae TaxID=2737173 RepID=UPI001F25BF60|nr:hypothetical protein [Actinomyces marmotae]
MGMDMMGGMGPMGGGLEAQSRAIGSLQGSLAAYMEQVGATEAGIEIETVGLRASVQTTAIINGAQQANVIPGEIVQEAVQLRVAMAHPRGGTWTWAHLTMTAPDYRLKVNVDYDRKPDLDPPVSAKDCADELSHFPRDPGTTPDWMRPAR